MADDRLFGRILAFGLAVLLPACAYLPQNGVVMRAPQAPAVVSRGGALPPCPPQLIAQTQWLARNMARLRLGFSKLQVVGVVGDPAHAETFQLANTAVIEVLFYHTPETICRVSASLGSAEQGFMPMVFQDDRLIGYGPSYYRDFIVPQLRPTTVPPAPQGQPQSQIQGQTQQASPQAVSLQPTTPLRPAPARTGRWEQEDLPPAGNTPLPRDAAPTGTAAQNGYSEDMNSKNTMRPVGYVYEETTRLGRGEPLQ